MQESRGDIKATLIDAARIIFTKNGYNKATVDEIAKSVGKGKSTFYYYFSSKEEIYKSVIEKEASLFRAKILESISIDADSSEKIKKYIITRLVVFSDLMNLFRAVSDNETEKLSFIDEIRTKYEKEQLSIVKVALLDAVEKEEIDIKEIDLAAETIDIVLKGLEYNLAFESECDSAIESKVGKVIDVIYRGIIKR